MTEFRDFIEKAERDVSAYFRYCPLCFAEDSMEFHWGFKDDTMSCSKCGGKWHINHGIGGFHWARLIKVNAEGKGTELLGKKKDPFFWRQMALNGLTLAEQTPREEEVEQPEEPKEQLTKETEKEATKEVTVETETGEEEKPLWWNPLKYFLHGISFSILMVLLGIGWAFIFGVLVVLGSVIGLIIGFVLFFLLMGGLNVFLSDLIWSVSARTAWTSLLGHGIVLAIVFLIASLPAIVINLSSLNLAITIALFIAYAFIHGFIAKHIAEYFEEGYEESD